MDSIIDSIVVSQVEGAYHFDLLAVKTDINVSCCCNVYASGLRC